MQVFCLPFLLGLSWATSPLFRVGACGVCFWTFSFDGFDLILWAALMRSQPCVKYALFSLGMEHILCHRSWWLSTGLLIHHLCLSGGEGSVLIHDILLLWICVHPFIPELTCIWIPEKQLPFLTYPCHISTPIFCMPHFLHEALCTWLKTLFNWPFPACPITVNCTSKSLWVLD